MINYSLLDKSISHYTEHGFKRIESPWAVSEYIIDLTLDNPIRHKNKLLHNNKCLVGSGEQSFLYLMLKDFLPRGKYQTITPCFRDEPFFDLTHTKYFMKNELINTENVSKLYLIEIIDAALLFFRQYFEKVELIDNHSKTPSYVINVKIDNNEYEIGSYGIRKTDWCEWIYGTGLAEPRFSTLLKIQNGIS